MLGIKYTMPELYVPHRWLSVYSVVVDTLRLLDALTVFYFGFLPKSDRTHYFPRVVEILKRRSCTSAEQKAQLQTTWETLSKKKMTSDGQLRKQKVLDGLFQNRKEVLFIMHFYVAVLPMLKSYVVLFETKSPSIHKLHEEQVRLVRGFLSLYVRPEKIPAKSKDLAHLELQEKDYLSHSDMFLGTNAKKALMEGKRENVVPMLQKVRTAYIECGQYLIKKMPINNNTLKWVSALDPQARGHSLTLKYLLHLAEMVQTVLKCEDRDAYEIEVRQFQVDTKLSNLQDGQRIDEWWSCVALSNTYPLLAKVALALLSCFHGPQVESTFSIMGQVLDPQSSRLNVTSLSAIQTIKYSLKASGESATKFFRRDRVALDPVDGRLSANMRSSYAEYKKEQEAALREKEEKKQQLAAKSEEAASKQAVKLAAILASKKARQHHKRKVKRLAKGHRSNKKL